jgi:serine/threonine-protein kinase
MKLCLICNFQTASDDQGVCPHDGSPMVTVGDDPLLGILVEDRYRIQALLGQGSAGSVYRARQELIGRDVAIKVLHDYLVSDDEFVKRFKQEAKAASRLNHPNIITIYDFGIIPQGRRPYIAMDLLTGTPLSELISQSDHIPVETVIPIFKMVCQALAEAHRQGVVHRDIKPENIVLVERGGKKLFPIVVDFGIARLIQEESDAAKITRTGTVCGSPTYMSPEQCTSSKVDHRSDIYSLGVVLFEALTGNVPFTAEELVKVMTMHLLDTPPTLSATRPDLTFPDKLETVVSRALNKHPEDRYQNMDEFAYVLEESIKAPQKTLIAMPSMSSLPALPAPSEREVATRLVDRTNSSRPLAPEDHHMIGGGPPQTLRELANRTLTEMMTRAKTDEEPTFSQRAAAASNRIMTSRIKQASNHPIASAWQLIARQILPVIFTACAILAVITFVISEVRLMKLTPQRHTTKYASTLVKQGRYEEALPVLQDLKQKGQLDKIQTEDLNKVRVYVAKIYARKRHYSDAVSLLEQVPQRSKHAEKAHTLIRNYQTGRE